MRRFRATKKAAALLKAFIGNRRPAALARAHRFVKPQFELDPVLFRFQFVDACCEHFPVEGWRSVDTVQLSFVRGPSLFECFKVDRHGHVDKRLGREAARMAA